MQTTLQRALARRGIACRACAQTGCRPLPQWPALQPDVVVLDLTLPGQDGLQVLEQPARARPATPVLILTARGTVGDRVLGLNAGGRRLPGQALRPGRAGSTPACAGSGAAQALKRSRAQRQAMTAVGAMRLDKDSGALYHHGASPWSSRRASWR